MALKQAREQRLKLLYHIAIVVAVGGVFVTIPANLLGYTTFALCFLVFQAICLGVEIGLLIYLKGEVY